MTLGLYLYVCSGSEELSSVKFLKSEYFALRRSAASVQSILNKGMKEEAQSQSDEL